MNRRPRWPNWHGLAFCLAMGFTWEAVALVGLLPSRLFPPFSLVLIRLMELNIQGTLPSALAVTLGHMAAGFSLAAMLSIPCGIAMGHSRRIEDLFSPTVESLRSLPPGVVVLPAMLFLGIGGLMHVFVVFFACAFPILLNTADSVRSIPKPFLDTARNLGVGCLRLACEVLAPAALPGLFSGLKTAMPVAFIVAMISEMVGGSEGLGHYLLRSQRSFDIPEMYAGIIEASLAGMVLSKGLGILEMRCLTWYFARNSLLRNTS
ncbi:MAG: ABC transporter permease [Desulfocurvibacter africanus]